MTSSLTVVDVNFIVYWREVVFKSNIKDQQTPAMLRYALKSLYHRCPMRIEKSVPREHCLVSLNKDSWCQAVPNRRPMNDSYKPDQTSVVCRVVSMLYENVQYNKSISASTLLLTIKTAADDIVMFFTKKISLGILCESSAKSVT